MVASGTAVLARISSTIPHDNPPTSLASSAVASAGHASRLRPVDVSQGELRAVHGQRALDRAVAGNARRSRHGARLFLGSRRLQWERSRSSDQQSENGGIRPA